MIAVDTNVLVYAAIASSERHSRASAILLKLAEGAEGWAIPWPCLYEFLRVVTHPRVYSPPMPLKKARAAVAEIVRSPSLVLLSETDRHAAMLATVLSETDVVGNLMHDAHIAALCREYGVAEIITGDRDFLRFRGFKVTNPF